MDSVLVVILLILGCARVTQLITEDKFPFGPIRDWANQRWPESYLSYGLGCWWCCSVYTAAGAAAFAVWVLNLHLQDIIDWKEFLLLWPALSFSAVGIMGAVDWLTGAPDHD
jgi:hypothetical protein